MSIEVTYPGAGFLPLVGGAMTGPLGLASYTWATVPAAGTAGRLVYCSDFGAGGTVLRDNGTRWKPVGIADLSSLDTASSNIANTATIVHQYQLGINMLQLKDRLRIRFTMSKSGTTDTGTLRVYMGTAGTTADTQVYSGIILVAANQSGAVDMDFRLETATTISKLGVTAGGAQAGYSQVSSAAYAGAITITSAVANALYVSIGILSSSTNDTVALQDAQIQLRATTA